MSTRPRSTGASSQLDIEPEQPEQSLNTRLNIHRHQQTSATHVSIRHYSGDEDSDSHTAVKIESEISGSVMSKSQPPSSRGSVRQPAPVPQPKPSTSPPSTSSTSTSSSTSYLGPRPRRRRHNTHSPPRQAGSWSTEPSSTNRAKRSSTQGARRDLDSVLVAQWQDQASPPQATLVKH